MRILYSYWTGLIITLIVLIFVSLSCGSQYIPLTEVFNSSYSSMNEIIYSLRLPRILNAITVGALLAMAGLMIQNLVKNPLADPYILGLSGASASVQWTHCANMAVFVGWLYCSYGFVNVVDSAVNQQEIKYKCAITQWCGDGFCIWSCN